MALEHDIRWPGSDLPQDIFVGVDLGQAHDYTAIVVVEGCQYHDFYRVVSLERMRHVDYPIIVKRGEDIVNSYVRTGENTHLIVDKTGVGAPVVDLMFAKNLNPVAQVGTWTVGEPDATYVQVWNNVNPSNPMVLGTPEQVTAAARNIIQSTGGRGIFLSSGCALGRDTRPENMRALVAAAKEFGTF